MCQIGDLTQLQISDLRHVEAEAGECHLDCGSGDGGDHCMSCFEDVPYYGEWSLAGGSLPAYSLLLFTV